MAARGVAWAAPRAEAAQADDLADVENLEAENRDDRIVAVEGTGSLFSSISDLNELVVLIALT